MSDYSLFFNPQFSAYPTDAPESFYARWSDEFNPTSIFGVNQKKVRAIELDLNDTYDFTPSDLALDDIPMIVARVIGEARIKALGEDLTRPITGYLPAYGTATFPGYIVLSTFNATGFEFKGLADDTTIELFYGSSGGAVGAVGELISNTSGTVTLTTSQFNDAGTISLTAGTWDIEGNIRFDCAATTVCTRQIAGIGTVTGNSSTGVSTPENASDVAYPAGYVPASVVCHQTPTWRVVITATTSYYLKSFSTFTTSTQTCVGYIRATRIR